jgi:hypothetical protein
MTAVFREVGSNSIRSMSFLTPETVCTVAFAESRKTNCSYAEAFAPSGSPPFQDSSARFRGHPFQKPVSSLSFQITGLKCHFHGNLPDNSCCFIHKKPQIVFSHAFGGNRIF